MGRLIQICMLWATLSAWVHAGMQLLTADNSIESVAAVCGCASLSSLLLTVELIALPEVARWMELNIEEANRDVHG
jgi:hypothetical protein